ncbi:ABC transporter permease [Raineyella sp. W15-4]|uniref:ABC transporter permease n=1 Tax=Raineyella sp. W15-4 TaxID=3081651 RepID=UPI002954DC7D|nr:ABC transporter permease [Raineyella sp. W15-4]WOQ15921.1 ABC transporter permease [Raineyella sp. W15-4]
MTVNLVQRLSGAAVFSRRQGGPGLAVAYLAVAVIVLAAVLAPVLAPYDPNAMDLTATSRPPSFGSGHVLGTDTLGRDILSRVLWGARPPLLIASASVLLGVVIGVSLGTLAGYLGRGVDESLARLADIQLSIPGLVLALVFLSLFGSSSVNVVVIIGVESWPLYFRVVRSQVRSVRSRGYVEAARLAGLRVPKLLRRHVLPNSYAVLIVAVTLNFTSAVLAESSLSFLGIGIQPPTPDWGVMIAEGQTQLATASWIALVPGAFLVILILSSQVLADELAARHALKDLVGGGAA